MRFYRVVLSSLAGCVFVAVLATPRVSGQEPIQAIKDLYTAAAYDEALAAIGKLQGPPNLEAEQYRVFCLVALGRLDAAERAAEGVLNANPEFRPDPSQASPRIQGLFRDARRRLGPGLVKRLYQEGRAAMERKDRDEAMARFEAMLRLADDPDVRTDPTIAELKVLGSGFLDLSKALRPAVAEPPAPAPTPAATPAAGEAAAAVSEAITPPVVIQQRLPPWVPDLSARATEYRGAIKVQISADGKVVAAEMVKSVHPAYDQVLLRAARGWLYQPARRGGIEVASEKTIEIAVGPPKTRPPAADKSQP